MPLDHMPDALNLAQGLEHTPGTLLARAGAAPQLASASSPVPALPPPLPTAPSVPLNAPALAPDPLIVSERPAGSPPEMPGHAASEHTAAPALDPSSSPSTTPNPSPNPPAIEKESLLSSPISNLIFVETALSQEPAKRPKPKGHTPGASVIDRVLGPLENKSPLPDLSQAARTRYWPELRMG